MRPGRRVGWIPEALLGLGFSLLIVSGAWAATASGEERRVGGVAGVATSRDLTKPAKNEDLAITDVSLSAGSRTAVLSWKTVGRAKSYVAAKAGAFGEERWTLPRRAATHSVRLTQLIPYSTYRLFIVASRDGDTVRKAVTVKTKAS